MIAGLASFPRAMVAGVVIGVVQAVIGFNFLSQPGLIDLVLLVAVLVAVWLQSRQPGAESRRPTPRLPGADRSLPICWRCDGSATSTGW